MSGTHHRRTERIGGRHWALTRVPAVGCAVLLGTVGAAVVLPSSASAASALTCGATISTPGTYVLGADCTGDGITIDTSNVTLKLNGHTMTNTSYGATDGVLVDDSAGPLSGVTVQGPGTMNGYINGVELGVDAADFGYSPGYGVGNSVVSDLTIVNSADVSIALSSNSANDTISENYTSGGNRVGIWVFGTENTINRNTANGDTIGIDLDYGSNGNTANLNTADNDSYYGIEVDGDNNTVNNNSVNDDGTPVVVGGSGDITNNNT